ncbi:MAG: arginine--tRNA ligase [Leptospira sp.]|nr:arginine--tRNA ligase [Leptospira sp.]
MKTSQLLKEQVLYFIQESAAHYLNTLQIPVDSARVRIEYSRDEKFGDYSTSFALENKKIISGNPLDIANSLLEIMNSKENSKIMFSNITVTPPGFINFRMREKFIRDYLNSHLMKNDLFAELAEKKKINLEFVSANPTGPLNIVSARAASYGDALASLLSTLGHKVDREFYVNDYGNQVRLLGVAVLLRYKELLGASISFQEEDDGRSLDELIESNVLPAESYRGEYIIDIVTALKEDAREVDFIESKLKTKEYDELVEYLSKKAIEFNLNGQKKDLLDFGVKFDRFFSERSLHEAGEVMKSLTYLEKANSIFTEDKKKVFRSTDFGDDKDRVVVRDDGRPTYLLADIAYHKNKIDRGYDEILDIWGPDHHGYIARLSGAMQSMNYPKENFTVIICQQVNLLEEGKKVKMSKRLGNFQRMKDLIHYLGNSARDVGRYFFITRTAEAPLDFDLDLAKDESDKNPVFYLQYAHARISSIFREVGEDYSLDWDENFEWTDERGRVLFWVARFHEEIFDAAMNREPHRITTYLQFLCKAFTRFYGAKENRLKDSDESTKMQLAYLCKVTQLAIRESLSLLGISAPEKMEKVSE